MGYRVREHMASSTFEWWPPSVACVGVGCKSLQTCVDNNMHRGRQQVSTNRCWRAVSSWCSQAGDSAGRRLTGGESLVLYYGFEYRRYGFFQRRVEHGREKGADERMASGYGEEASWRCFPKGRSGAGDKDMGLRRLPWSVGSSWVYMKSTGMEW